MAKKKDTRATKAKQGGAARRVRGGDRTTERPATAKAPRAAAPEGSMTAAPPGARVRDPRLPTPGTVIQKCARDGSVRCEVTVEADGIRYKGTLYRSLSAAALAAAKDLGIRGRAQNGYTFFGLSKPPRRVGDPLEVLGRAWERYRDRATAVVGAVTDDNREQVRDVVEKHVEVIKDLRRKVG
ncbi:MAG: DUF2924 domain-containing protein [Deltaproteobacteria bacterium]|nr:DUF2924 domain-containing protein [Deltaproteobacteria bacterium]